jgi:hypothetical protein
MVHLTNDFDVDSTIKGFNYQGVHSFDVALSARSRKLIYFRKAKRREAKVIGCRIAEPQDRVIQLLTSGKVCNQSTRRAGFRASAAATRKTGQTYFEALAHWKTQGLRPPL